MSEEVHDFKIRMTQSHEKDSESHKRGVTLSKTASHRIYVILVAYASQFTSENHQNIASLLKNVNPETFASPVLFVTPMVSASHINIVTHCIYASHIFNVSHEMLASQHDIVTHTTYASHKRGVNHTKIVSTSGNLDPIYNGVFFLFFISLFSRRLIT